MLVLPRGLCHTGCMHFVVRCIGHKKRELKVGETLGTGRGPSNDLVLNGPTVSAEHVVVRWDPDQAFPIVEIKSPVDIDDTIHEDALFLNDYTTLGLGDSAVIFQPKGLKKSEAAPAPRQKPPTNAEGFRLFSEDTMRVQGSFSSTDALYEVLSGLEANKRTGTLEIKVGDEVTKVMFGAGALITVKRAGASGMQAVGELFALEEGDYEFAAKISLSEKSLNLSIKKLVAGIVR